MSTWLGYENAIQENRRSAADAFLKRDGPALNALNDYWVVLEEQHAIIEDREVFPYRMGATGSKGMSTRPREIMRDARRRKQDRADNEYPGSIIPATQW